MTQPPMTVRQLRDCLDKLEAARDLPQGIEDYLRRGQALAERIGALRKIELEDLPVARLEEAAGDLDQAAAAREELRTYLAEGAAFLAALSGACAPENRRSRLPKAAARVVREKIVEVLRQSSGAVPRRALARQAGALAGVSEEVAAHILPATQREGAIVAPERGRYALP